MDNLIIAPHADDETLGCGGLISRYKSHLVLCADEPLKPVKEVLDFYGFTSFHHLKLKDGRFDEHNFGDIVKSIFDIVDKIRPDRVFIPYIHDIHSDHRIISEASYSACKVFRAPYVKSIYMYEVLSQSNLSSIPFKPDTYLDISRDIPRKLYALSFYNDCNFPMVRGKKEVEALALFRGSQCYQEYSEAFMTIRNILG